MTALLSLYLTAHFACLLLFSAPLFSFLDPLKFLNILDFKTESSVISQIFFLQHLLILHEALLYMERKGWWGIRGTPLTAGSAVVLKSTYVHDDADTLLIIDATISDTVSTNWAFFFFFDPWPSFPAFILFTANWDKKLCLPNNQNRRMEQKLYWHCQGWQWN